MNRLLMALAVLLMVVLLVKVPRRHDNLIRRGGVVYADEIWSGVLTVTGDIVVMPWATVTVLPGTKVMMTAGSDDTSMGQEAILDEVTRADPTATREYDATHITITVWGRLDAVGTPSRKIVFTSDALIQRHTDWNGIIFTRRLARGAIRHAVVEWTHYGISLEDTNNVDISHNTVRHTFWGGIHAFRCSPVFEYNTIHDVGHEAFDTHKASPTIRHNTIRHAMTGAVFNSHGGKPIVFEHNTIQDSCYLMTLQEGARAVIRDNVFRGTSTNLPRPWRHKDFEIPCGVKRSVGILLADNIDVQIRDNLFYGIADYSVTYREVGPNLGIGHTTRKPEPFKISGPVKISVVGNRLCKAAPISPVDGRHKPWKNFVASDNVQSCKQAGTR